jgi:regulator-associated protein of mTOR
MCNQELPTGADSCITSLSLDHVGKNVVVGGCGDGTVRIFDKRLPPTEW